MLTKYLTQTKRLLQNPSATSQLYSDVDLTSWINTARGQLAGEAECIRVLGTLATVANQQVYDFGDIDTGVPATSGVDGVLNIRRVNYNVGSGSRWIPPRPWEWFDFYVLNNPVPQGAVPSVWAQYGQGAAPGTNTGSINGGSLYINLPDNAYTLNCDCVCYPIPLVDDTTKEAIPYLWTDAVPFFAAYYALLSAQTGERTADAERYFNHYTIFVERARKASNPSTLRWQSPQTSDPAQVSKLGLKPTQPVGGQQ